MSEMPDPLELFRQSLETQRQQIELSRIQVEKSAEFAHEALKADYADREKQRDHELKIQRNAMIFIISLVVVLLVLLMVAFVINKEAATEMVRAIGYLLAIGAAYIIGRYRGMKSGER
jgi:ABC-type lipoprotein release transport system permease subunit